MHRHVILAAAAALLIGATLHADPLRVCATVPDLGDLAREIGGEDIEVTVFVKGAEDPHFIEAKPSFIKALSRADVFLVAGMELEIGWVPPLVQGARNPRIAGGQPGFVDASEVITPLDVPTEPVTRAMGDVHAEGNPHYLTDPLNGLKVADRIREALSEVRPERTAAFQARYDDFEKRLLAGLEQWKADLAPFKGAKLVADHNMWPYFAERYGFTLAAFLEPKPGMPPTTKHLNEVVARMKAEGLTTVITAAYFDPKHANFVAKATGASVVPLAHQVGARPGTETYIAMCTYNASQLAKARKE